MDEDQEKLRKRSMDGFDHRPRAERAIRVVAVDDQAQASAFLLPFVVQSSNKILFLNE